MANHTLRIAQVAPETLPRGLAVVTRFAGPTNARGSRVIATCKRDNETTFRATVEYDHAVGTLEAHYSAALACLAKIETQNDCYSFRFQAVASTVDGYSFTTEAVCIHG